ncbi:MAG: hypothetical protein A2782_01120 [Candidatus Blackburnbacteria bacterium RIFCSPHIGHO2_01_FULL_43_15b]|uniref:DUF2283 domain-containing protein n=1 Tax=Candidatus Blackburnbacteria bacterium RIFCSPHIGHO2_01_FULL_43_15b TaxID=1797513 RepID=A0A1G1V234_9BACT|nr:MAG: hypothetical protein A2782_01120 [Candidatus Blackburnbacteria bacterium RIFCSPHIGHO2_01_FULL_43_15b]
MSKIKVYYDSKGKTLTVWFDDPKKEAISEEIGDGTIVSKDKRGRIILTPSEFLVEELAGSVPVPKEWKGKDIDEVIESARSEYYLEKYSSK